jgi:hypothetical protein
MGIPIPNPVYLQALDGTTWVPGVSNSGIATTTQLSPAAGAGPTPGVELNDAITGTTWRLVVMPSPTQPGGMQGQLHADPVTPAVPGLPTQLLVSAPNGVVYFLQIANGVLQSGLATPASASCNVPISVLAQNVIQRLEESNPPVFWNLQLEILTALVEAMNEMTLLVGRPTMIVQSIFNLNPNSVWQYLPRGMLALTDVYGPQSPLRKVSLFSLDYEQASWQSDWENDSSISGPVRWFPVGLNLWGVHPAAGAVQQVIVNAVAYPVAAPFPYTGAETVPFEHNYFQALEMYASVYLRTKEGTSELQNALPMLAEFYQIAARMTDIQDRRDNLIFSRDFGIMAGTNQIVKR